MSHYESGFLHSEFVIMVAYSILGLPVVFLVFFILIWKRSVFNSSFFKIYLVRGAVDIFVYFNKIIIVRVPIYTCATCYFADLLRSTRNTFFTISYWLHWHTMDIQYLLVVVLAFDRFIVLIRNGACKQYWRSVYVYVIIFVFILPTPFTYNVLEGITYYDFRNESGNFMSESTADWTLYYDSTISFMVISSIISMIVNSTVIMMFVTGYIKISQNTRRVEFNLCVNSFVEASFLSVTAAGLAAQRFLVPYPEAFKFTRIFVQFALDGVTLLPPFILIFTSQGLRTQILQFPGIRKIVEVCNKSKPVQKTVSSTSRNTFPSPRN